RSAYALTNHWRFFSEKPRSVWIDGRATFTIAMSSTTMNWTPSRRASASHFRCDAAIMGGRPFSRLGCACHPTGVTFVSQVISCEPEVSRLDWHRDAEIRAVLSRGPRALLRRGAVVAADRPRAVARPEALHGSEPRPARDRHEHPRRAAARARGLRDRPEADAPAARGIDRLRADGARRRAEGDGLRA